MYLKIFHFIVALSEQFIYPTIPLQIRCVIVHLFVCLFSCFTATAYSQCHIGTISYPDSNKNQNKGKGVQIYILTEFFNATTKHSVR